MKRLLALLVPLLACGSAQPAGNCPVTERELLGSWGASGNAGFFEEFMLEANDGERVFNSWLHQRPELSGAAWKLENCRLIVMPRRGEFDRFTFRVLGLKKGRLRLYDESTRIESTYRRSRNGS